MSVNKRTKVLSREKENLGVTLRDLTTRYFCKGVITFYEERPYKILRLPGGILAMKRKFLSFKLSP